MTHDKSLSLLDYKLPLNALSIHNNQNSEHSELHNATYPYYLMIFEMFEMHIHVQ